MGGLFIILGFLFFQSTSGQTVTELKAQVEELSRQVMMQQTYREEETRTGGHSGVKQKRVWEDGTRPYHSSSHVGRNVAAIHDHANNVRTVGMGEFAAVLNGVEFRTRHNDFRLSMPSHTSTEYHSTEEIPFPEVPKAVTDKPTTAEQIKEMREWFRAWQKQDFSVRDYREYFKPVLCYLEGAWTTAAANGKIDEPFVSDRHLLDAFSWNELEQKIRFTSYTGTKDRFENYAYLPRTIIDIKDGKPVFAQWNYRIMCHPLKNDLPLNRFRVVDDLTSRLAFKNTMAKHAETRAARFQLNPYNKATWVEGHSVRGFLDDLMGEVPGKNNYQANLKDEILNITALQFNKTTPINAGFYHRNYKVDQRGAMGSKLRRRSFSDDTVFMAKTSQTKVAPSRLETCNYKLGKLECKSEFERWSYAVPLEIIYLTPLPNWNPYNIQYKGDENTSPGRTVYDNGRTGDDDPNKAYDGTNSKYFYQTPAEFFIGDIAQVDAADTDKGVYLYVKDRQGKVRKVVASGHRVFLPPVIEAEKPIRQRYPIMPIHGEGSGSWKELEALKDIVLEPAKYKHMYRQPISTGGSASPETGGETSGEENYVYDDTAY